MSGGAKCAAHNAPRAWCFLCDARLREPGRLWCQEHNRYEDRCWLCHPEARDKQRLWCEEHALYEDECFLCHPELKSKAPSSSAPQAALMCKEHGVLEAECAICHPEAVAQLKPGEGLQVRLPSPQSAGMVGLQTAATGSGKVTESVECLAEIIFNQNKLAHIAAPLSGILHTVEAELGAHVKEKQTVARIWSAAIAETVARAVLSHQTLERERKLRASRVTSQAALDEAEAAHRAVCQQLRTLGFTEEQVDEVGRLAPDQVLLEVRAPFAGEIIERTGVRGTLVEAGRPLFTLADTSTMWAMLQVPATALPHLQTGLTVELRVDALPGQVFTGTLTWVGPALDERTRMARARAEFPNPDGRLKDRMFARARIVVRQRDNAVLVPGAAIQYLEGRPIVFVRRTDDLYEVRAVELGARVGEHREIMAGLKLAEPVAVSRSFALKSALLISRLGAGCADD
ncbi:MAG: efflux RND transporter periplasmic adaptor subunit [Verrucomicrobiae bacterium]|nr:efflux RND transporter periplasmic adaptor subunit [Verrucomicrobiae bacterium]